MPDENLLATLENGLRQSRMTRSRLNARLADLEAEAERVRTELNEMDAIISQTEAAMFRILSSSFGSPQATPSPSDAEIEFALRRDAAAAQRMQQQQQSQQQPPRAPYAPSQPQQHEHAFRHQIPPIRHDTEPKSDRFFERTIPHATAVLLRESGGPLHVNEIYNRMLEGGFQFTGQNPTISIAVSLNRNRRFRKVAPGTFDLTIRDAAQAS